MKKFLPLLLSTLIFSTVTAAEQQASNNVLLTIDDTPINENLYRLYHNERKLPEVSGPEQLKQQQLAVMNELINTVLLSKDALDKKLDQGVGVKEALELARMKVLTQAAIVDYLKNNQASDEELKSIYEKEVEKLKGAVEYKARHILQETEADAKAIISKLDEGAEFKKLAQEKSTGPSGKQGGDLGWFSPATMVPEFSKATAELREGQYTRKPVQTKFGWHVILLEGKRQQAAPGFDDVKTNLANQVSKQKLQQYVNQLRSKSKIEVKQKEAEKK